MIQSPPSAQAGASTSTDSTLFLVTHLDDSYVSLFRLLRRALRWIDVRMTIRIPVILASTNSSICNFFPKIDNDSSRREYSTREDVSYKTFLHRPMVLKETFDIWAKGHVSLDICNWSGYFQSISYITRLAYFGRPFWGALMSTPGKSVLARFADAIFAASGKYPGFVQTIYQERDELDLDIASALGYTIYLRPLDTSDFASSLVRSRLGFIHVYYPFCQRFNVGLAAEPIMGLLANHYLFKRDMLFTALHSLVRLIGFGSINLGENGELAARFVLLSAFQLSESFVVYHNYNREVLNCVERAAPRCLLAVLKKLGQLDDQLLAVSDSLDSPQGQIAEYESRFESEVRAKMAAVHDIVAQGEPGNAELEELQEYVAGVQSRLEECGYHFNAMDVDEESAPKRGMTDQPESRLRIEEMLHTIADLEARLDSQPVMDQDSSFMSTLKRFLRGSISLVQWAQSERSDFEQDSWLQMTAIRGAGLITYANCTGVDMIIPVALEDGELAALLIQVKNTKATPSRSEVENKRMEFCIRYNITNSLLILFNFSEGPTTVSIRPEGFLEVNGMEYAFLEHLPSDVYNQIVTITGMNRVSTVTCADEYAFPGLTRALVRY